jgi:hypothetical protein
MWERPEQGLLTLLAMRENGTLIRSEANGRRIVLDLKDVTLVGRDAISFLERWEAKGIALKNCAGYVREWISRSRGGT